MTMNSTMSDSFQYFESASTWFSDSGNFYPRMHGPENTSFSSSNTILQYSKPYPDTYHSIFLAILNLSGVLTKSLSLVGDR